MTRYNEKKITPLTHPADLSKASAKVKGEIPGTGKEVEKKADLWATEAGQKIDSAVCLTRP
jgi:hypothetical protein